MLSRLTGAQSWRRRYFVLEGTMLRYYAGVGQAEKGCMDCAGLQQVKVAPSKDKPFQFYIRTQERTLHLQAGDDESMQGWVAAFRGIMA